jgi:microcystin-dependent protein
MSSFQQLNVSPNSTDTSVVPTGTVIQFASSTAPSGYLNCNGSAISRSTYSNLFNLIGTTYGLGNGAPIVCSTWVTALGSIFINFNNTNTSIVTGSSFSFTTGSTTYPNLIATSANTAQIQAVVTFTGTGVNDGSTVQLTNPTTFNLPNTVGVTIRGSGTSWTIASTGGADTYALTPANIASHAHSATTQGSGFATTGGGYGNSANSGNTASAILNSSGSVVTASGANGSSFSIQNPYLVLNYCIKY